MPLSSITTLDGFVRDGDDQGDFRRAGMAHDIIQRFFDHQKKIVAHFGGDGFRAAGNPANQRDNRCLLCAGIRR